MGEAIFGSDNTPFRADEHFIKDHAAQWGTLEQVALSGAEVTPPVQPVAEEPQPDQLAE